MEQINVEKKRIEYIDLMKGICISLVVVYHCGIVFKDTYKIYNDCLMMFILPLYFFISGLFFNEKEDFKSFLQKKINNLLFPYLFFSSFILIVNFFIQKYPVGSIGKYLFFCFLEPYNYPLWFLRSLFIVHILYYFLCISIKNINYRILVCFLLSIITWLLAPYLKNHINIFSTIILLHLNILSSIFVLPFISIADWCRNKGLLSFNIPLKLKICGFFFSLILLLNFSTPNLNLLNAQFSDNLFFFYISSISGIFCVLFFSSFFNKIPLFSYIGRYSLIVLGVHAILIMILRYLLPNLQSSVLAIIILGSAPVYIFFFKTFFPYFTAQKPLCQYINGKFFFRKKKINI